VATLNIQPAITAALIIKNIGLESKLRELGEICGVVQTNEGALKMWRGLDVFRGQTAAPNIVPYEITSRQVFLQVILGAWQAKRFLIRRLPTLLSGVSGQWTISRSLFS
jgi:hypothetical protein